ncbi:hypothetical protein BDV19DRAFT_357840 [Aspergillus venezuelensis]
MQWQRQRLLPVSPVAQIRSKGQGVQRPVTNLSTAGLQMFALCGGLCIFAVGRIPTCVNEDMWFALYGVKPFKTKALRCSQLVCRARTLCSAG